MAVGRICAVLAAGAVVGLEAAPLSIDQFQITNWRTEQSLPTNKIMAVAQDHEGYVWIATYAGLVRFDGVKFVLYNNNTIPSWTDSAVTCLYVSRRGVLWIGHSNGAVSSHERGQFEHYPVQSDSYRNKIIAVAEDGVGNIWIQDNVGHVVRLRDGLVLTPEVGDAAGLYEMTTSPQGDLWVSSRGNLSRLSNDHFETVPLSPGMDPYLHGISGSADGGLWVLSGNRLCKWRNRTWTVEPGDLEIGGTPVRALIETKDGRLVGGTSDHGAVILQPGDRSKDVRLSRTSGLASDWVQGVCEDQEGGLWLATGTAGLFRLREKSVANLISPDAWQGRAVLSVCPSRDGGFLVGTEGAGLYRLNGDNWTCYAKDAGIRNPYVWSVLEDAQGDLWLGTWGGGVYMSKGDQFQRAPELENFSAPIVALAAARQGGIWIGSLQGIMRYFEGHITWVEAGPTRRIRDVRTILEEPDGTLWVGSNGDGLGQFHDGNLRQYRRADGLSSDFVQCLFREPDGTLWIGTRGGGLNRLKAGRLTTVGVKNGLADGSICHIEDDGLGYFWMSSHGGILRVSKAELDRCANGELGRVACLAYGLSDGLLTLASSEALQPSGGKTQDGRLVFAMDRGLAVIDPRNVRLNTHEPPVCIENVRFGDHEISVGASPAEPIVIGPGQNRVEFKYTGLSFSAPEKVHFKHRLEGLESDWVFVDTERSAVYNYLPPGRYVFHVTAANNNDVWNQQGRSLAIVVLPYYWQTLWFKTGVVLALLLVTAGVVWFQTRRRLQRKLELLERERAIEAERTRIANDMHDDLGAHLTRITMLSETVRTQLGASTQGAAGLNLIYDTARNVTRAMDEIVWAVNPKHDTLESLVFYFEKFAFDLLGPAGIRCRLDFPSDFPPWRPGSEVRHNLFLAYKEALNNAVRHSGADTVTVQLEFAAAGCTLIVSDNGRGVTGDKATTDPNRISSGNGLLNMERRLTHLKGRCEVKYPPGGGCVVSLFVPVDAPGCSGTAA